jgi:manganese transport protein
MYKTAPTQKSLDEIHGTIDTTVHTTWWRRLFSFLGPAYLISVGYMDPGNWATDIAGGSKYGYALIWVLVLSNLSAILLQSLCARLGIVRRLDLAQASRIEYPRFINLVLYGLAEVAITATDLAEILGMAVGLYLLFDLPLLWGVLITFFDTILLFWLLGKGVRRMEAVILTLISIIGVAFLVQIILAKPDAAGIAGGLFPHLPDSGALYIAIGIIGATVMPHNLYLHSALVQTRSTSRNERGLRDAIKFNVIDSSIALNLALFVNAAILILAASTFNVHGFREVTDITDAHTLLAPLLGSTLAPILFAVALIAAGQSSTVTGTLAGQVVMEGYLGLRLRPWVRRIITRALAIIPAIVVIALAGDGAVGELLVLSQVILSLQLGFAIVPLIRFVSDKRRMGVFAIKLWIKILAWTVAVVIVGLNVNLIYEELTSWASSGSAPAIVVATVSSLVFILGGTLLYITFAPIRGGTEAEADTHVAPSVIEIGSALQTQRIGVTVDFTKADSRAISTAMNIARSGATLVIIHVIETTTARIFGRSVDDAETITDSTRLDNYVSQITSQGIACEAHLRPGVPNKAIVDAVTELNIDMLVMASHGHRVIGDLIRGATIDRVRHNVSIPVLIIPPST